MKIIFAIPNYNMRESLGRLLTGLSAEQADHIYVLDDASADGSADYVSAAFPEVTVVRGDLELRSTGLAQAVQDWFSNEKLGLAGSLILDRSGRPSRWNYGWTMGPVHDARGRVYEGLARMTPARHGGALPDPPACTEASGLL
jgi:GT2 family glycosyltransferase